jgi:hypothetical protein
MSNDLMIVLATASAAALIGGGLVAWFSARQRPVADPAEESRREIQSLELRDTVERCRQESRAAQQQLATQQAELQNATAHLGQSLRGRVEELEMERNAITGSLRRLSA